MRGLRLAERIQTAAGGNEDSGMARCADRPGVPVAPERVFQGPLRGRSGLRAILVSSQETALRGTCWLLAREGDGLSQGEASRRRNGSEEDAGPEGRHPPTWTRVLIHNPARDVQVPSGPPALAHAGGAGSGARTPKQARGSTRDAMEGSYAPTRRRISAAQARQALARQFRRRTWIPARVRSTWEPAASSSNSQPGS